MQTLLIVNGEDYWADYFPEYHVHRCRLQASKWLWRDDELWAVDASGWTQVDAILWKQDVRCLVIGEEVWAMSRRGAGWKANRGVADYSLIEVPPLLFEYSKRLQRHLGADVLALDCLQTRDGEWFVLEYNDIPGLSGFPEAARYRCCSLRARANVEVCRRIEYSINHGNTLQRRCSGTRISHRRL